MWKPPIASKSRNSLSVRSHPPIPPNMFRSDITTERLSTVGSSLSGTTLSMTIKRAPRSKTRRQFRKIRMQRSSLQSWIMLFIMIASAPDGRDSKKLPAINSNRSATPASDTFLTAASAQCGKSKTMPRIVGSFFRTAPISSPTPPPTSISTGIPEKSYAERMSGTAERVMEAMASLNKPASFVFAITSKRSCPSPASSSAVLPVRIELDELAPSGSQHAAFQQRPQP